MINTDAGNKTSHSAAYHNNSDQEIGNPHVRKMPGPQLREDPKWLLSAPEQIEDHS